MLPVMMMMPKFPLPYETIRPDEIRLDKVPEYHKEDRICNQVIGSLVGLAIGDALGASVEFRPAEYLAAHPVREMEGGGTWGLEAGKWTDDTSMALCLASSLITQNDFNPYDQMVRYRWWQKYGYFSSTGHCFDIGQATRQALDRFSTQQKHLKRSYRCRNEYEVDTLSWDSVQRVKAFHLYDKENDSAGNGALMRLAAVPLFYMENDEVGIENAGKSASLTHANQRAIDACRYYAALIIAALRGSTKDELLDKHFYLKNRKKFGEKSLHDDILSVCQGSYQKDRTKDGYQQGIRGKGFIVNALEAALWAFWSDENSFEKGVLLAVNLGDDTDTTAAIYGQLAGAYYGYDNIPKQWKEKLYALDLIKSMAEWIYFKGKQNKSVIHTENSSEIHENNNHFNSSCSSPFQYSPAATRSIDHHQSQFSFFKSSTRPNASNDSTIFAYEHPFYSKNT